MNYKDFLSICIDLTNIDFDFIMNKKQQMILLSITTDNDLLNNIAFAPISINDKKKILDLLSNRAIDIDRLNTILSESYINFLDKYDDAVVRIKVYIDYFYDWMNFNKTKKSVRFLLKNVNTHNSLFWFYLTKKFYLESLYDETYILIKYLKKHYIKPSNYIYEELSLYEVISIKNSKNYLDIPKWQNKLKNLLKVLKNYEVLQITTNLELDLLSDNISNFQTNFLKYKNIIFSFSMINILNIFELAIYTQNKNIIFSIQKRIILKNILAYKDSKEILIYMLLSSIKDNDNKKTILYIIKLRNQYDFKHLQWFAKTTNNKNILEILNAKS